MGDDVRAGLSSVRFAVGPNLSFEDRIIRYEQARRHFEAALAAANNQQKPGGKDVPSVVPPPSISDAKMLLLKLDWQMLAAKTLRGRADMTVAEGADVSVMELSFFDAASNQQRLCVELLWQADQVRRGELGACVTSGNWRRCLRQQKPVSFLRLLGGGHVQDGV